MMLHLFVGLVVTLTMCSLGVYVAWLYQKKTLNAGIVDAVWSLNFLWAAIASLLLMDGWLPRKLLVAALVSAWSLRLGLYLLKRNLGKHEDRRYTRLREEWGSEANTRMLRFFFFQAVINTILSIPFFLASGNHTPYITMPDILGAVVVVVAVCGESLADNQLKKFKSLHTDTKAVCDTGLWAFSRHPNYFFEWLAWVGFALPALFSPYGIWAILSPALMYYFLIHVTGIPMTEALMAERKGASYIHYQQTTSAFIPWFKKKKT